MENTKIDFKLKSNNAFKLTTDELATHNLFVQQLDRENPETPIHTGKSYVKQLHKYAARYFNQDEVTENTRLVNANAELKAKLANSTHAENEVTELRATTKELKQTIKNLEAMPQGLEVSEDAQIEFANICKAFRACKEEITASEVLMEMVEGFRSIQKATNIKVNEKLLPKF